MGMHQDIFSPTFVRIYFISVIWICGFFILNMTVATMLMKYAEADGQSDDGPNQFEDELKKMGDQIFGEYKALPEFIISQDSVEVDMKAVRHMKKEKSFYNSFFSRKVIKVDDPTSSYYRNPIVKVCMSVI